MNSRPRVLIVEDDFDIRRTLDGVLREEGFEVVNACDGTDAVEVLRQGPCPAAILTDLLMPGMGGAALIAALSEDSRWKAIPVVIMSVRPPPTGWLGPYLKKPFELNHMLAVLRAATRRAPTPSSGSEGATAP